MRTGLILGLRPANEGGRYFVTTSLIGWPQANRLLIGTRIMTWTSTWHMGHHVIHWYSKPGSQYLLSAIGWMIGHFFIMNYAVYIIHYINFKWPPKNLNSPAYRLFIQQCLQADINGVLFWTACTRRTHVLSLPSRCEKSDSWRHSGSIKTAKKSWTVPQCGHVTPSCVQMASKQANVEFSSHIFQFTRLHGVTVMQGLTFWDSVVTLFKSARWYILSGTRFLVAHQLYIGNGMRECKIGKSSLHQPCENTCHSNVLELSLLWMARALACF